MINIDPKNFRQVLSHYPTGVCVVTSCSEEAGVQALVVGSFTSISLDPPLVGFFPAKTSVTWQGIAEVGRFCINVLSSEQFAECAQIASGGKGKLDSIAFTETPSGQPVLEGCTAWIDCSLTAVHDVGDHWLAVGGVLALETNSEDQPLIFYKGKYHRPRDLDSTSFD